MPQAMGLHSATGLDPDATAPGFQAVPMRRHSSEHLLITGEAEEAHTHFETKPRKAL